ncbi:hypothetical protein ACEPAI_7074 [Sanghuangporus weigelae]
MSFSSTPLGQDRRLDHQAFLKGQPYTLGTNNPPKRVPSITHPVPISYAYGAPTLAARSAKPPSSSNQIGRRQGTDDSEEENRRARYTQLKQRNETLANRPGSSLGPGVITTPPLPNEATLNPTSVNIASAFNVAAASYTMTSTANQWTSSRANLPRSTSVEYEQQSHTNVSRRLPVPSRQGTGSKPPSSAKSVPNIRGSDAENDRSGDSVGPNGRGKSPFEHISEYAQRAVSQATFLMRQRSQEPEDVRPPSRQATDTTLVPQNNSNSYDYAEEEEEFQEIEKSSRKPNSSAPKRNRMSVDNKAYRPTASDEEEETDEGSVDGRRGRRRRKKRESGGGPLTNMPAIHYDKRRKRKGRLGKAGEEDVSVEDDQEQSRTSDQQARRSVTPQQRQPSLPRSSVPLDSSRSYSHNGQPNGFDLETGLDSIPEVDEMTVLQPEKEDLKASAKQRPRSRSRSRTRPARQSAIGGPLGTLVNVLVRLFAVFFLFLGRLIGFIFSVVVREPLLFIRRHNVLPRLSKYAVLGVVLYLAMRTLKGFDVSSVLNSIGYHTPFVAPDVPPESIDELTSRLLKLENMFVGLQSDAVNDRNRFYNDARKTQEVAAHLIQLQSRVDKELTRMQKSGEDAQSSTFKGLEGIQREVRALQVQQSELSSRTEFPKSDEEARVKLRAFEERLGSVEGGVKEALELSQNVAKAGSAVVGAGSASHWWSKLGSGSTTGLTIKAGDGSDVTQLIGQMVDQALIHRTADGIARLDYALSSGGAYVIPSLTSPTLEIRSNYFFGLISGSSVHARSPVTALHHETALGYCWPFAGSQGHLGVKLATPVRITDFTIDHVPRSVAHDMRPAPRHMEVWGLVEGKDNLEKLRAYRAGLEVGRKAAEVEGQSLPGDLPRPSSLPKNAEYMRIGSFMYDINDPHNIQTFSVPDEVRELGIDFGIVVLFVNDNWGMKEFTCLYRFRVHGERKLELPAPDP